jgi:biopolymer transport protein ExbB/TolQ
MTTIEGLAIAIPSLLLYAFFKHRADTLIADAAGLAEYSFAGYKRERIARRSTSAS